MSTAIALGMTAGHRLCNATASRIKNPVAQKYYGISLLKPGDDLLSHGETPNYHRRCIVSLLSSGWNQVGPILYGRQANLLR